MATDHVPGLDGLRGLAVAAVVAYHLGWLSGGFLGVDVFFVLSGYLVTSLVLAEVEGTGRLGLRAFWGRRLRRLVPAVLVLVPVVLLAALAVRWPPTQLRSLAVDGLATLTWWANWRQVAGTSYWAPGPSPFRHAWSLSVEEQFYLAWPVLVIVAVAVARWRGWSVRRVVGSVAVVGTAASAAWSVVLARATDAEDLSRVYLGTDTRILAPLAGCALACWWPGRGAGRALGRRGRAALAGAGHLALAGLAVAVATVHVPDPGLYRQGGFALVAAATVLLVRAVVEDRPGGLLPVASWAPLRHLGSRSYAIYLWSWPTQVLVQLWRPTWSRVVVSLVVVVVSLVAAELSYRLVEDPLRRRRSWAARPALRRPAWALGVAACVAALLVAQDRSLPVPEFERIDTAEAVERASQPPPTAPADPVDRAVMVAGDSVAFMATFHAPAASEMPPGIGSIDGRGVIGCGILAATGWEYPVRGQQGFAAPAGGDCVGQAQAEAIGLGGRPDVVLLIGGAWEWDAARSPEGTVVAARSPEMADALVDALLLRARAADAAGAAFALAEWSCPGAAAAPQRRDPAYVAWVNGVFSRAVDEAVAAGIDAALVPPTEEICAGGDPTGAPTDAWRAATEDEVHVRNHEGGLLLWQRWLGPALVALTPDR